MATELNCRTGAYHFGTGCPTALVGARINVLDTPELVGALQNGDLSLVETLARQQQYGGMHILDVMLDHPDLDVARVMPSVIQAAANASALPISIDSADPKVLEAALRDYPYKALVNSVNGEEWKLESVLPLVREAGAAVVGLTMDDAGIPDSADARFAIAEKIVMRAERQGIPRDNIVIDVLCLSAGASAQDAMGVTLDALRRVKRELATTTLLGVYNVGHGMPAKTVANMAALVMGIGAGLDAAIMDPIDERDEMTIKMADFIAGQDPFARSLLGYYRQIKKGSAGR